jgi:hypothetical protein
MMNLWWLAFRDGSAVIIEGKSLTHARLLAAANRLARPSQFCDGYPIDPDLVELIPADATFRKLSAVEGGELLKLLSGARRKLGQHARAA